MSFLTRIVPALLVVACAAAAEEPKTFLITGTISYRERIAPLPGVELTVQLVDVSRADAPAMVIAEQVIPADDRQVPIPFELAYDPAKIEANHTYAVQAWIGTKDKIAFRTDQRYEVITCGAPTRVDLLLKRIRAGQLE